MPTLKKDLAAIDDAIGSTSPKDWLRGTEALARVKIRLTKALEQEALLVRAKRNNKPHEQP